MIGKISNFTLKSHSANLSNTTNSSSFSPNIKEFKEYTTNDPKELSNFFKEEGNKFFNRKDYDIAIIYFTKAIEQDNTNKVYFSNRSACYLAKGSYRLALKDALKCVELDQTYMKGYYRGSLAYLEMNDVARANTLIEKYISTSQAKDDEVKVLVSMIEKKGIEHNEMRVKFKSYDRYIRFTQALYQCDAYFPKVDLHFYSDDHRGVVAKSDISKEEVILVIPRDLLISIELAASSELGKAIAGFMYKELNSPKHCLLSSFLLSEKNKGDNSKWKFYLDILPRDYSNFPVFFTDDDLTLLQGSPFLAQVIEKKNDMRKDYNKICSIIPEFLNFDYIEFCEARMAISSRIFGIKIDYKKTDVLAPYADLLNHRRPRQTHWYYDEKSKAFLIQSLEDIHAGDEIFDSYGKKCNSRFFLNYGFIVEGNDANEFPIVVKLDSTCPHFTEKSFFFKCEADYTKKFRISENMLDYQVIDLFSFLRFAQYSGDLSVLFKVRQFLFII